MNMRNVYFALAVLAFYAHAVPVLASSSDCGLIKDETMRRTCYARNSHKESDCNLIRDRDAERMCRALSKR